MAPPKLTAPLSVSPWLPGVVPSTVEPSEIRPPELVSVAVLPRVTAEV